MKQIPIDTNCFLSFWAFANRFAFSTTWGKLLSSVPRFLCPTQTCESFLCEHGEEVNGGQGWFCQCLFSAVSHGDLFFKLLLAVRWYGGLWRFNLNILEHSDSIQWIYHFRRWRSHHQQKLKEIKSHKSASSTWAVLLYWPHALQDLRVVVA